jgi:non-homologous end joining protein Ku
MEKTNLKELKAYAKQKGIKGYSKLKKDELRQFIQSQSNKQIDRIKLLSSTPLETIYDDMTYYAIMDRGRGSYDTFVKKMEKDEPNYYMKFR